MLSYPQVTLSTLEAIYRLGKNICDEIEKFQPDVVIGLAHSGWMPVVVAQTLWLETRRASFPSSTRTNIGQEKHEIYHARYGTDPPAYCCGECCNGETGRLSHYLAWVVEQSAWQKTFRKQIKAIRPSEPKRILVVDDLFGGYRTGYATLALLDALYPKAEISMCAGDDDLTDNFVTGWLEAFIPQLAKEIRDLGADSTKVRFGSSWQMVLKPLINGTEDITPDSLDWQFITSESAAVKAVAEYVPAEVALSTPQWAKDHACMYALQRLRGEIKEDEVVEPSEGGLTTHLSLTPEERLAARAWRQSGVTSLDITQIYGSDPEKVKKGLHDVKVEHEWQTHGQKPQELYFPLESFGAWPNAYYPSDPPIISKPKILVHGFAEFLHGEVWAGVFPIPAHHRSQEDFFKYFLGTGVNYIIDLTTPQEFHGKFSYRSILSQVAQEIKRQAEVEKFPLPFRAAPSRLKVQHILKHLSRALKQGKRIYIHAGHNLEGRTPLLLACLLIERGYSAKKALAKVDAFWMKTLHYLICSPLSEEQRQFILDWKRAG